MFKNYGCSHSLCEVNPGKDPPGPKRPKQASQRRENGRSCQPRPRKLENLVGRRAWNPNNHALLQDAEAHEVDVILLQETNRSEVATATCMHTAQRYRWQALHFPATKSHTGWVAVLVRQPLAVVELACFSTEHSRLMPALDGRMMSNVMALGKP